MILAHDLGTTGDRASLHEPGGRPVTTATVNYDTRFAASGVSEQGLQGWWRACCVATQRLLTGTDPAWMAWEAWFPRRRSPE